MSDWTVSTERTPAEGRIPRSWTSAILKDGRLAMLCTHYGNKRQAEHSARCAMDRMAKEEER